MEFNPWMIVTNFIAMMLSYYFTRKYLERKNKKDEHQ